DRLYVLGPSGDLACLEAASGKIVWEKSFSEDFQGHLMSGWGYSESPLIDGDNLICTPGADSAALVALDKKNGNVIWKASVIGAAGAGYSSAVAAEVGGVRMYLNWLGRSLVGVNAKDGKLLWQYKQNANGTANIPTPIVRDDIVFCSTGYQKGLA